ncbi:hypothetical protein CBR_g88533 [Chara braunii]|uniref:Uncharacterized protein n=1 Tax=Chara braunii TaxID=69332 RepID=A0A388KB03_CHABU|nr:hypothetical protein CBR_g88533 [Chara braunii]|eukprot:GBG67244.1 hypothetical protein CBR_g88533 [Chara braunii]
MSLDLTHLFTEVARCYQQEVGASDLQDLTARFLDDMVPIEQLQSGAAEWLETIEEGGCRLQEVVAILCSSHGDQSGAVGGTITLAPWLKDMMQSMLEVIWELEEGPTPSIEEFVDWHQAGLLMHRCYDIFRNGRNRCAALEAGLSPATTNEDSRGDNRFSTNIDYNDSNDNDNNNDNNINNNNNKLTIINSSSLSVLNGNGGDDIISRGIDVGGGESINKNGDNNDNSDFNSIINNSDNNSKQLKNINYGVVGDNTTDGINDNNKYGYGNEAKDDKDDSEIDHGFCWLAADGRGLVGEEWS